MVRSMTNEEMVQHLTDRINELEQENRHLIKDDLVVKPTCKKAVDVFGKEHTMLAAIAEMSELTQALTKVMRGKADFDLIDRKIADVEILMECVKFVFHNSRRVLAWKEKKVGVLMDGIKDGTAYDEEY